MLQNQYIISYQIFEIHNFCFDVFLVRTIVFFVKLKKVKKGGLDPQKGESTTFIGVDINLM